MRKLFISCFILILVFSFTTGNAQTLNEGDAAITGYISSQSGVTDRVSLVLLKAIPSGEAIKLTDNGWTGSDFNSTNKEGCVRIVTTSPLAAGTELTIIFTAGAPTITLSSGTATVVVHTNGTYFGGDVPDLASGGDQILVYRGTEVNPTFITGIHTSNALIPLSNSSNWDGQSLSTSQSAMPIGLNGLSALWLSNGQLIGMEVTNGRINCALVDFSTVASAKLALFNLGNWIRVTTTGAAATFTLPSGCPYLVPRITTHPSPSSACVGSVVNFTVAATGADLTYQWQEDDNAGFSTPTVLSSTGIYSNTSTPTLTISDNTSVNGMYYRCVVSNTAGSSNSIDALLIAAIPSIVSAPTVIQPTCGTLTGTIVINATGTGALEYNIGGPGWFPVGTFSGLTPGSYNISVRLIIAPHCVTPYANNPVIINAGPPAPIVGTPTVTQPDCSTPTGSIIVNATGSCAMECNIAGSGWFPVGTFSGLVPGSYNILVRYITYPGIFSSYSGNPVVLNATVGCPAITTHPSASTACASSPVSFTVVATGSGLSYQWQEDDNAGFLSPADLSNTGIYSNTSTGTLNISDNTSVNGMYYRCVVTNTSGFVNSNGALLTVSTPTLPSSNQLVVHDINTSNYFYASSCQLIAKVVPSGANPVSGNVTAKTWKETSAFIYSGRRFLQRHYEVKPATDASTATATVTLYFSQADFDDYNAAISSFKLPASPSDVQGISNLKIIKLGGSTNDGTGLPGSYSGTLVYMDPFDQNIVWNPQFNWWEVTVNVSGFSGFFVTTRPFTIDYTISSCSGTRANIQNPTTWIPFDSYQWEESADSAFTSPTILSSTGVYTINSAYLIITDVTSLGGRYYRRVDYSGSNVVAIYNGVKLIVTPPTLSPGEATATAELSHNGFAYVQGCTLICRVVPDGVAPVIGGSGAYVWRENAVIAYNGQTYVQRHYQVKHSDDEYGPFFTSRVTLYFSQNEFDNFNADQGSTFNLPANPADAAGKANLRVIRYPGITNNGTGLPGSYSSGISIIDPDDADIVWNATFNFWEITFDEAGFSAFFIGSSNDVTFCPGSNFKLNANAYEYSSFQWQLDDGTGFVNLSNGGHYSGATTVSLNISSIPSSFYNYKYRCVINGSTFTAVMTIKASATWTGNISTDWLDPLNWSCSGIPDANTDVWIGANPMRSPVVNNNITIRSLTASPGVNIIVATGVSLTINH